jgi:hypothetical protein
MSPWFETLSSVETQLQARALQQQAYLSGLQAQRPGLRPFFDPMERSMRAKPGYIYDGNTDTEIPDPNAPIRLRLQVETDEALKGVFD